LPAGEAVEVLVDALGLVVGQRADPDVEPVGVHSVGEDRDGDRIAHRPHPRIG
jgi:hypothetical protein